MRARSSAPFFFFFFFFFFSASRATRSNSSAWGDGGRASSLDRVVDNECNGWDAERRREPIRNFGHASPLHLFERAKAKPRDGRKTPCQGRPTEVLTTPRSTTWASSGSSTAAEFDRPDCRTARSFLSNTPKAPAGSLSTRRSLRRSPAAWAPASSHRRRRSRDPGLRRRRGVGPNRRRRRPLRLAGRTARRLLPGHALACPGLERLAVAVAVDNRRETELPCDALFIQDLGLADPGFLMSNEAYACQYLDHLVARHPRADPS